MSETEQDPREAVRWSSESFTFATPEAFEAQRGEKWIRPGTRNHETLATEIRREYRRDDDFVEIEDAHAALLPSLLVGRTIVAVERDLSSGQDFPQGENDVEITLDDGSRLVFSAWGYDAWGVIMSYAPPAEPETS